ncbi:hypothetical protein LEMLEM_LOCUS19184, partial [Lemmus lemmus]
MLLFASGQKAGSLDPPQILKLGKSSLDQTDNHNSILEEDVDFVHGLVIAMARLNISNHTVPGHSLLESRAARRQLIDTRGADGIVCPIEGDKVGFHREGAKTFGWPTVPDSRAYLTD